MVVNYEENNIVNLSNSILKYFDVEPFHNTLENLDKLLEEKKYKNIVLFVCDGLGFYNLKELLDKEDFLRSKKTIKLSSVFPPTTAAATTTLLSGLTPSEHHWFGWDMYFKDTNETISVFLNKIKDTETSPKINVIDKYYMKYKNIIDLINENSSNKAYFAYPFSLDNKCLNIDEVIERIKKLTKENTKKFIYAYIENPDKLMHKYGIDSKEVYEEVKSINNKIENLSKDLKDTLILVTADHGLINTETVLLKNSLTKIYNMLKRTTSIEPRSVGIKLKDNVKKDDFIKLYKKELEKDFKLLTGEEVIKSKLFGNCDSSYLRDNIGDYLLIGITNKLLIDNEYVPNFKAGHAGFTKKELTVPLIIIDCK